MAFWPHQYFSSQASGTPHSACSTLLAVRDAGRPVVQGGKPIHETVTVWTLIFCKDSCCHPSPPVGTCCSSCWGGGCFSSTSPRLVLWLALSHRLCWSDPVPVRGIVFKRAGPLLFCSWKPVLMWKPLLPRARHAVRKPKLSTRWYKEGHRGTDVWGTPSTTFQPSLVASWM